VRRYQDVGADPWHNSQPDARDYLQVVLRWKGSILAVMALVLGLAVAVTLSDTPRYAAKASVLVGLADAPRNANQRVEPERLMATQAALAAIPVVAARTLRGAGVDDLSPQQFLETSEVTPSPKHDILVFRVTAGQRGRAMKLATRYAREFIRYRRKIDGGRYVRKVGEAFLVAPAQRTKQTDPETARNMGLGLALGVIGGLLLAFIRHALDTRARSVAEIAARLGLPLLGRVPKPSRRQRSKGRVLVADPDGVGAEPFRILRTNLLLHGAERYARTIMITSALQQEGKTTTAANLAVALARTGRRVILADLDIRRSFMRSAFELDGASAVPAAGGGAVSLDDQLVRVPVADSEDAQLHVLPATSFPANGDFFAGGRVAPLLADLRARADIVLIDGPPLLGSGDGVALASEVDALVIVSRMDTAHRSVLDETRRVLTMCTAQKLGVVVTATPRDAAYRESGVLVVPTPASPAAAYSSNGHNHPSKLN
jgi:succinoglycan biosynthesis transport protein ExoP